MRFLNVKFTYKQLAIVFQSFNTILSLNFNIYLMIQLH
ncbi:hypothetical protein CLV82_0436 [Zeaxanthinibacter enoshimensis]|uniref:Uncharacterized protein n=1 Tax=Zeaxanthinibacter enoshimensis TaxID=392009 RepID=A0A4R6TR42_9FLAO|nr:hypothetical protein CLV82_0436 [Zeaxanthinibacter enoshimensis]